METNILQWGYYFMLISNMVYQSTLLFMQNFIDDRDFSARVLKTMINMFYLQKMKNLVFFLVVGIAMQSCFVLLQMLTEMLHSIRIRFFGNHLHYLVIMQFNSVIFSGFRNRPQMR